MQRGASQERRGRAALRRAQLRADRAGRGGEGRTACRAAGNGSPRPFTDGRRRRRMTNGVRRFLFQADGGRVGESTQRPAARQPRACRREGSAARRKNRRRRRRVPVDQRRWRRRRRRLSVGGDDSPAHREAEISRT
eukprot:366031-Chlamydomonas_euryale.AAC.4